MLWAAAINASSTTADDASGLEVLFHECRTPQASFRALRSKSGLSRYFTALEELDVPADDDVSEQTKSALSGQWEFILGEIQGFEDYLLLSGVSWAKRTMAKNLIGKFKVKMEINNSGDKFLIAVNLPTGVDTKEFVVGGPSFQSTFGPEKIPGTGEAGWEGDALVMNVRMTGQNTETRRWLESGVLIEQNKLFKDGKTAVMKRKFKKVA